MTECQRITHSVLDFSVFGGSPEKREADVSHLLECSHCRSVAEYVQSVLMETTETTRIPDSIVLTGMEATSAHNDGFVVESMIGKLEKYIGYLKDSSSVPNDDIPTDIRDIVLKIAHGEGARDILDRSVRYIEAILRSTSVSADPGSTQHTSW